MTIHHSVMIDILNDDQRRYDYRYHSRRESNMYDFRRESSDQSRSRDRTERITRTMTDQSQDNVTPPPNARIINSPQEEE